MYDSLELVQKEYKPWEYKELERLDSEAQRIYSEAKKHNSKAVALEMTADIYRESPLIKKVVVKGLSLDVYNIFYDGRCHISFEYDVGPMPENLPTKQEIAEKVKSTWMSRLSRVGVVIHSYTGSSSIPSSKFCNTLRDIMCDESLILLDKYCGLRSLDIKIIDCKAIIYNFNPQMWGYQK
jgi:hypothetical protein